MIAGYRFDAVGSSNEGYKKYFATPSEPVLFALTASVSVHGVTTGFQVVDSRDEEHHFPFQSAFINPDVIVAIPTNGPMRELNAFDYSSAAQRAQVNLPH